ncbi:ankyrin repeat domain-containing protein [Lutimonas sp.]|uniref:ankyrin repeat domain-containing protein n=1 Tax=Lutimonas sp. TaxID=1872403 RepID=UPI003D9BE4DF
MKTQKMNSIKTVLSISLLVLLITSACAQSGANAKSDSKNSAVAKSLVDTPDMDLQTAVMTGNLEVVKQHIAAGTDLNKKDQMSGSTPITTAATFDHKEIAKALIDAGADLSIKNNDGATPLHVAAFFCRVEIAQSLLDAKADKNAKNNFGATPGQSVSGPYAEIKPIYEMLQQQLSPIGLQLDLNEIEKLRPVMAMMLQ